MSEAPAVTVAVHGSWTAEVPPELARSASPSAPEAEIGRPRERVSGYLAGTALPATVVAFGVLGDLLLRLADRQMVSLDGPWWALRPDSDAHRRARTEAVRDTRRRAEEYPAAAGARLTGLVEVSDVGLSAHEGSPAVPATGVFRSAAESVVADEPSF